MALSIAAFTFTSCEDVPEPYNNPYDQIKPSEPEVVIEPAGSGTVEDPYNIAKALEVCQEVGEGGTTENVYARGIITSITDLATYDPVTDQGYGNATFLIADNNSSSTLTVFRAYSLGNEKFTKSDEIAEGDTVVICGKLVNYKGNTPEFTQGCYIYSIKKGQGGGDTPATPGTAEKPLTVAEALAYTNALAADKQSPVGYVKGKICAIKEVDTGQYGNATYSISDDGTEDNALQVYRGYSLNGAKFKATDEIKVGDEVIVTGKLVNYKGNTPQFAQGSSIYSLNGSNGGNGGNGGGTSTSEGNGTAASPYNVTAALAAASGTGVYVKGFIVGSIDGKSTTDAKFSTETETLSNILIAASADETDITKCMPVQLPTGAIRTALNLKDNAGNYKKEVTLYGNIEKYFSVTGLKSVTFAILGGTEIGTNPEGGNTGGDNEGGDTNTGTLDNPLTASQAYDLVAAMTADQASTADYYVKGKISSIKYTFSAQYGTATFNFSDDGTANGKEFIAYSTYYFGSEQKWVEGNTQVQVGDEVIVCGKVVNYKGDTPEFASKKSYVVKINSQTAASRRK